MLRFEAIYPSSARVPGAASILAKASQDRGHSGAEAAGGLSAVIGSGGLKMKLHSRQQNT
ncbi:MAG: hypothetical protein EXR54_03050 [Dehalococcoidia bacterium]|nr:hypothetical protein [Dehalococcoidia bacterium]MSQ16534.1 hypothetical protein [Dehalococcoidia bacterium]